MTDGKMLLKNGSGLWAARKKGKYRVLSPVTHVLPLTMIVRPRLLPVEGEVLVRAGQKVRASDVIATAVPAPKHQMINVGNRWGLNDEEARRYIERTVGERVEKGDIIATKEGFGRRILRSSVSGTIVVIAGGVVIIRADRKPFELLAGLPGTVSNLIPDRGIEIESIGALIQGVWGNGRVDFGLLNVLADKPDHLLTPDLLDVSLRGSVVLGGHCQDKETLQVSREQRLRGLILGSLASDLRTMATKMPYPIVLLDGFGSHPMNEVAFTLLQTNDKRDIALNAELFNYRQGIRPELLIPLPGSSEMDNPISMDTLSPGQQVRIIRAPYRGVIGRLVSLQKGMKMFSHGLRSRAAKVRLADEQVIEVPVANLEILR